MKLKKILTAVAAAAVMTSLLAVGAYAAGNDVTNVSYDKTTGNVTFDIPEALSTALDGKDMTLVILKADEDGSRGDVTDARIMQIDQNSTTTINAKLGKDLTEGKFYVLLGGDGNLYTSAMYEITDGSSTDNPFANCTRLLGDADGNGSINGTDALAVMNYEAGKTSKITTDELKEAADCDDNGAVNGTDALAILNYEAGKTSKLGDGTKTVADKANYVTITKTE